jgi:integrase
MGSIEKTSAGTWRARYRDPQGRSRRETFRRKGDAQRFLENAGVDMQRGSWVDPQLGRVTLAEWVEEWWTTAVHLRPSTRSRYERDLRLHLLPRFGAQSLATITPREVRAWVAEMVAAGVPPSGVNRRLRLFSRLMNAAVENELLARSPAKGVRAPEAARKETRFLTATEVRDLAEAINPWFRVWVYFAAYTGIRWSEMLGLRRKDIDLLRRTVTVERQLLEVQSRFLGFGPPKSAAGRRTIALPDFLVSLLEEQLAERARPGPDGLVFVNTAGNPAHAAGFNAFTWARAKRRAGLEGVRWHDLRHTAVALAIEQGAHAKAIQERMGHASVSVTLDRYGHLLPSLGERIAEGLDSAFQAAEGASRSLATVTKMRKAQDPAPVRPR